MLWKAWARALHLTCKLEFAASLRSLPKAACSRLVVIEVDVASVDSIKRGLALLGLEHKINSFDVVLADAGVAALSP
jgi:norsolorinic acid ketoreductase